MPTLNIKKLANAFVPNAIASPSLGGEAAYAVDRFRKKHGGLWVGGSVTATSQGLHFAPNKMNLALHVDLQDMYIPLPSIQSVRREFGWVTGIVIVRHTEGEFRFRCFGAKQFATTIGAHVAML